MTTANATTIGPEAQTKGHQIFKAIFERSLNFRVELGFDDACRFIERIDHYNDFEAWRGHRDELLQEAEERRLARQLRAVRSGKNAPEIRHSLHRLVAGLLPQGRKMAGC